MKSIIFMRENNLKAYFAGPITCREVIMLVASDICEKYGWVIGSEWLYDKNGGYDKGNMREKALRDIADIDTCDVFVHVNIPAVSSGAFSELGYAYAKGKRIIIIGDKTSLFHFLLED